MAPADAPGALRVEVLYAAGPQQADAVTLDLPAGATLADALAASGLAARHPDLAAQPMAEWRVGVWGRAGTLEQPLRDGDRVECYRPLTVDPKEARRQRYHLHRARRAGSGAPPA